MKRLVDLVVNANLNTSTSSNAEEEICERIINYLKCKFPMIYYSFYNEGSLKREINVSYYYEPYEQEPFFYDISISQKVEKIFSELYPEFSL